MEIQSTISMVTIRMDKNNNNFTHNTTGTTTKTKEKSCSTNLVPTNQNKRKILFHQSCSNKQKQKKNPAPPILFRHQYTNTQKPQLIQTLQEQQRQQFSRQQQTVIENNNKLFDTLKIKYVLQECTSNDY